jgi:excisionase family DNA binding protein
MAEPLLMDASAAAEVLGISTTALRELVRDGRIRTVKGGKRDFFTREALEAFVAGDGRAFIG